MTPLPSLQNIRSRHLFKITHHHPGLSCPWIWLSLFLFLTKSAYVSIWHHSDHMFLWPYLSNRKNFKLFVMDRGGAYIARAWDIVKYAPFRPFRNNKIIKNTTSRGTKKQTKESVGKLTIQITSCTLSWKKGEREGREDLSLYIFILLCTTYLCESPQPLFVPGIPSDTPYGLTSPPPTT